MSHEVRSMTATQMPWHGVVDKILGPEATWDEHMEITWPEYQRGLEKAELPEHITLKDGRTVKLIHPAFIVADMYRGEGLGIVGKVFEAVQPQEFLEFVKTLEIQPETMIRLYGGAVLVACGRAPECDFTLGGAHGKVEAHIFASTGFNGSRRFVAAATPIKVVCANTERAALDVADSEETGFSYSTKNTTNIHDRLTVAAKQMAEAKRYFRVFREVAEELQAAPFSEELMLDFASELFETELEETVATWAAGLDTNATMEEVRQAIGASKESMDRSRANRLRASSRLVELFKHGKGNSGRTKWDAYSALTEHLDHERKFRRAESRFATIGLATHPLKTRGMKLLRRRAA